MGVPSFFAWLVKKYPDIILTDVKVDCDILLLDWNGGIHPACRQVMQRYNDVHLTRENIEAEMLTEICKYLHKIVEFAKPSKTLFIAIDGVAPRSKMNQQRMRRYKSVKDQETITEIRKQYGQPTGLHWDTNAITPGTAFMEKITQAMKKELKVNPLFHNLEVIFSDANTPMEGEHKLISYLKKIDVKDSKIQIYGLDADLIFLSLLSNVSNIYLLRERDNFNIKTTNPFCYLQVDVLKHYLYQDIVNKTQKDANMVNIVYDFAVFCFLLGNDFIPKIPSLYIKNGGIDILLESYACLLKQEKYIVDLSKKTISIDNFIELLRPISENEGFHCINFYKRFKKKESCTRTSTYDGAISNFENLNPCPDDDPVKLGKQGWKLRYYSHFFPNQKKSDICREYMNAINWIFQYYTVGVPSWSWYYPYHHAPVLSDFLSYLHGHQHVEFTTDNPVSPVVQLAAVLPRKSLSLLPKQICEKIQNI